MAYKTTWKPLEADKCAWRAIEQAKNGSYRGIEVLGWYFRLHEQSYSQIVDADREEYSSYTVVEIEAFPVIRKTPKGVYICGRKNQELILDHWKRKFAHPTWQEALVSYVARKRRQHQIHMARAASAEANLRRAVGAYACEDYAGISERLSALVNAGAPRPAGVGEPM